MTVTIVSVVSIHMGLLAITIMGLLPLLLYYYYLLILLLVFIYLVIWGLNFAVTCSLNDGQQAAVRLAAQGHSFLLSGPAGVYV